MGKPPPLRGQAAVGSIREGKALSVTRTREKRTIFATADPPYEKWEHSVLPFSIQGEKIAIVGEHVIVTGRCRDEAGNPRTGIFLYEDGDLRLDILLPSGGDTGYAGLLSVSESEFLMAYYSSHEYDRESDKLTHGPSDIYLASLSVG